jgi:hypothetical protein
MFNFRTAVQDCQVKVCATGRSFVRRNPTVCVCVCAPLGVIACNNYLLHPQRVARRVKTNNKKEMKEGWG